MEKWRVYLREVNTQIEFSKRSYEAFRTAEASNAVKDVFLHLHHFVIHAANINKLIDLKPETERHRVLAGHINLSGIDLKPVRRLRNHLEHFDERLDRWIQEHDGQAFFDMNIVTGSKGFPEKNFLRVLDGDTFKFYGEKYNISGLHASILEIERRMKE